MFCDGGGGVINMEICSVCGSDVEADDLIGEVCTGCADLHDTCGIYFILGSGQ